MDTAQLVVDLSHRIAECEALSRLVQHSFTAEETTESVSRVARAASALPGCALVRVPADYYSRSLRERAALLRAPQEALCKTLIYENRGGGPRYIAVVVQYIARVDTQALARVISVPGGARADVILCADGESVSGFSHGSVAPFGLRTEMPLLVASDAIKSSHVLWLGGGAPDVKLRVFSAPLSRVARVEPFSVPRDADDEAD